MYTELLKEMFSEMVEKKNAALIPQYYHEEFMLQANGQKQDYPYFLKFHEEVYQTDIRYKVDYDETAFVESGDKLAARVFFSIQKSATSPKKDLEVILICEFKDKKIWRLSELCYPDWTKMDEFDVK